MMFYFKWFLIVAIILFGLFNFVVSYFAAHDNCEGVAVVHFLYHSQGNFLKNLLTNGTDSARLNLTKERKGERKC